MKSSHTKRARAGATGSRFLWAGGPLRRTVVWPLLLAVAVLFGVAAGAVAKKKPRPTKTVTGQVFDASNRPVVGADVELTNLTTKKKLDMYTQQNGSYEFGGLSFNDNYRVQARYHGLVSPARIVSSWDPRAEMVLNLYLKPAKK